MAKVSVVIPVYNVERYLEQCLDSVQNQTLKDIEIICVDDGSTDLSGVILDSYAEKDSRFRVIHKQNEGYGKAMNVGIGMASAPYVGIVESDDFIALNMYESMLDFIQENQADMVKSDFYEFYENEEGYCIKEYIPVISDGNMQELYGKVFHIREHEEAFLFQKFNWNGLYDRVFLQREHIVHNETPGASYQDNGFWFQTMAKAKRICYMKQAFYHYRIDNLGSSMYSKAKVFAVCNEYDFIHDMIDGMGEEGKIFYKWAAFKKFSGAVSNISRVAGENKKMLTQRIKEEFLLAASRRELDPNLYSDEWKLKLFNIVADPEGYAQQEQDRRNKIENIVRDYDVIILYGAGEIGRRVRGALKEGRVHTKIKYYAVTDAGKDPESVFGIPVKQIDELKKYREKALVIISVGRRNTPEVENILRMKDFKHYIRFSDILN